MEEDKKVVVNANGFSPVTSTPVFWKSRKRSASMKNLHKDVKDEADKTTEGEKVRDDVMEEPPVVLSEKRKALFEPLEPIMDLNGRRPSAESLLPPPDFDSASYPRGWLIGKKRKLVNVDVVESMRRIAVQEMNRKRDRWPKRAIGRGLARAGTSPTAAAGRKKQTRRRGTTKCYVAEPG